MALLVRMNLKEKNYAMSVSVFTCKKNYYCSKSLISFSCTASFSNCTDKTYSNRNIGESDIWLNGPVYYSKLACHKENQKDFGKKHIVKLRCNCDLVLKTSILKWEF